MVHLGPKDMGAGGAMLPESVALITPKLASSIATSGSAAEPSKALAALPAQYRTVTVHRSQLKLSEALAKKTAEWSNVEFAAMLAREGYWLRKEMADEEIDLRLMQAQEREMVQQYVHRMGKAEEYGARERNDAAGIGSSKGLGHRGSISTTTGSDIVMGGNKTSTEGLGSKPRHPPPSITIPPIRGPGSNPNSGPNSAVSPTTVRTIRFPESTVPQPPTLGTVPGPGQVRDPRLPPPDPRLQRAAVPAATGIGMGTADTGNTAGVIGRQDPPPPPRVPVAHMCPTTPTPNLATHLQGLLPQPPTSSDTLGGGR